MKQKKRVLLFCILLLLIALAGYGGWQYYQHTVIDTSVFTTDDLKGFTNASTARYVLKDSHAEGWLKGSINYDSSIIEKAELDIQGVDLTKEGTYEVPVTYTVNAGNLKNHLERKPPKESQSKPQLFELKDKTTVEVVGIEKGKELGSQGRFVFGLQQYMRNQK